MESNTAGVHEFGGAAIIEHNCTLKIHLSRFVKNTASSWGAVFSLISLNVLEVQDSLFDSNYVLNYDGNGSALYIAGSSAFISIVTFNAAFNNCSAVQGGAIYLLKSEGVNL